ncbi:hypothetical protein TraAM80_02251 [Trypanosoma rangeli]|uniref:Uncharacterized protein n=1 Tax=Trypanosoma rangeli TaxID=5698 RepID=A0A3R7NP47_TRYRA|nr:uncharacterized protein TraAM80_02251 [Trypanosoma rangeli]RNF09304.1 hypothetical protein TraAM80_02251 [Trypanosoma rangeli]|eukprot:RNF09304.1 hypothetical protein TraAM80_02251 [Trypanosoma rangeli]
MPTCRGDSTAVQPVEGVAAGMTASFLSTAVSYFDLLVNSDPRVAFDVLHMGVLAAIEEDEARHPPGPTPRAASFAKAVVVGEGADVRFAIPTHQPALDARLPQPQDIRRRGCVSYLCFSVRTAGRAGASGAARGSEVSSAGAARAKRATTTAARDGIVYPSRRGGRGRRALRRTDWLIGWLCIHLCFCD